MATITRLADRRRTPAPGEKVRHELFDPLVVPQSVEAFAKLDYTLVAVFMAGGATRWVDIEDTAVLCYRLNPTEFRWAKYDYPNLDAVGNALRNIKKASGEMLLIAPSTRSTERRLTSAGVKRAHSLGELLVGKKFKDPIALTNTLLEKFATRSGEQTSPLPQSTMQSADAKATLSFISHHAVYRAWLKGKLVDVPRWQIADVLQCLPDSPPSVWRERLARYRSLATWWRQDRVDNFLSALEARANELQLL